MTRAKHIGIYRETVEQFAPDLAANYPSMAESFQDAPLDHKKEIVEYLSSAGDIDIMCMSRSHALDIFTGEDTGYIDDSRTDGVYSWGADLAYYVEEYNLRLPDDFVAHILAA